MRLAVLASCKRESSAGAFTITETVVAMGLMALMSAGLYGGIAMSFRNVQETREEVRASQINVQTLEVLRLCTWSQSSPATNFLPTSFTATYDNSGSTNLIYQVQITITNAPGITEIYSNDLRLVTVQTSWVNNGVTHSQSMSTYVAKAGLLWYVPY